MSSVGEDAETNAWDLCHRLIADGLGVAGAGRIEFAEPDFEQSWLSGTPRDLTLKALAAQSCEQTAPPDPSLPRENDNFWFRDPGHSELEAARSNVTGTAGAVRIAHLDTGYDPSHSTLPRRLDRARQRNFLQGEPPNDAADRTSGLFTNLGHGTGTLGILAGSTHAGADLGGAPEAGVVPIRVANSVVLFRNSAIARAFDYVYGLNQAPDARRHVHVITLSMGGIASQAWAEAINSLYDAGVFIVAAAGNNYGNLPTRHIVYPARFKRVVAACGVMANGKPYADLAITKMAGNYGPPGKMDTAMAAFTPNTPWARLGCDNIVDLDGRGTSSATPQIAAAAALWIQSHWNDCRNYPNGWQRVEAVRAALFGAAAKPDSASTKYFGQGLLKADLCDPPAPIPW